MKNSMKFSLKGSMECLVNEKKKKSSEDKQFMMMENRAEFVNGHY